MMDRKLNKNWIDIQSLLTEKRRWKRLYTEHAAWRTELAATLR